MRNQFSFTAFIFFILLGCSTFTERTEETKTSAYFKSRALDLADIFSFTFVLNSYGARAAISTTGVGLQMDGIVIAPTKEMGLRMGMLGTTSCYSYTFLLTVLEKCEFDFRDTEIRQIVEERKKSFSISQGETENNAIIGRVGISAGFIIGFRFEFNVLEAADFFTGLFGFDPLDDDIYKKDSRDNGLLTFLNSTYSNTKRAKEVIDRGLDVNTQNWGHDKKEVGNTLLMESIKANNFELSSYLLEKGADPNRANILGENSITVCSSRELLNLILNKTKFPITKEVLGNAISVYAKSDLIREEDEIIEVIKTLIEKGGDVNLNGGKALLNAYSKDRIKLMQYLITKENANTRFIYSDNAIGISNQPLLHHAVKSQRLDYAKKLLGMGFDINQVDDMYKESPLHLAAYHCEKVDMVKFLLKHGANNKLKSGNGKLPLDIVNVYVQNDPNNKYCNEMRDLLK